MRQSIPFLPARLGPFTAKPRILQMDRTESVDIESEQDTEGNAVYLARCQVDTPISMVEFVWRQVNERRPDAGDVVDFGCGDARFSQFGNFQSYLGFEIDPARAPKHRLPGNRRINIGCAFNGAEALSYDTSIGNPPYVRHHDLELDWLANAEHRLRKIADYQPDGRSNAFIYFLWLSLASVKDDGLVALVIPYEWVSRPSCAKLRDFVSRNGWDVDVYYFENVGFERVLTTACVSVIDKRAPRGGEWRFFNVSLTGEVSPVENASRSVHAHLGYERATAARANRGLSPGGQELFVLTEGERIRFRLKRGRDVVPAVTTFRYVDQTQKSFTETMFRDNFVNTGQRCWLINTSNSPSSELQAYLDQVPLEARSNWTCSNRAVWWKFTVPEPAQIIYAAGFKSIRPKMFKNACGAIHVGGIHGIYCGSSAAASRILDDLLEVDFASRVVALSNNFLKLEVNQMNTMLNSLSKYKSEI